MNTRRRIPWQNSFVTPAILLFQAMACGYNRFSSCESPEACNEPLGGSAGEESQGSDGEQLGGSGGQGGEVATQGGTAGATMTAGGFSGSGGDAATASSSSGGSSGAAGGPDLPSCPDGFERDADGECADIDECEADRGGCAPDAECHDSATPAEPPTCACADGFVGDGVECELAVIDFSVGDGQACAIRSDRSLACWGSNTHGQLGPEEVGGSLPLPTPIAEGMEWDSVSIGLMHTCGLSKGSVYCWGDGSYGALGQGEEATGTDLTEPARVGENDDWQQVEAGDTATCGIRGERLYCWGVVAESEDPLSFVSEPVQVGATTGWSDIALGRQHRCGIVDGYLLCFGKNQGNTLGLDVELAEEPSLVDNDNDWTMLSANDDYTCGIKENQLYCWGKDGPTSEEIGPEQVGTEAGWDAISVAGSAGCGIRAGALTCWGDGARGLRGAGDPDRFQVTATEFGSDWEKVGVGSEYACALKAGRLYCWGHNADGKLGVGDSLPASAATPERVGDIADWTTVSVGTQVSCGLHQGAAYCWGAQSADDLKYGAVPQQIGVESDWTSISVGQTTIAGVRSSDLFWWRYPPSESIVGSAVAPDPVQVGLGSTWHSVHTSRSYNGPTCAIGPSKGLYCYGSNNADGQLGLGDLEPRDAPTRVGMSSGWEAAATGSQHSCGIDGGRLFCWGRNDHGQLGLGDEVLGEDQLSPVQVGSADDWSDVAVSGGSNSCGIRQGELYCWGSESAVRPALGSSEDVSEPSRVGALTNWKQVTLGTAHGCGILDDGALYCWGDNTRDLLGLDTAGEPEHIAEPTLVDSGTSWVHVSAGSAHTCALQGDKSVWCWGSNLSGELGVPSWSTTPVPVSME